MMARKISPIAEKILTLRTMNNNKPVKTPIMPEPTLRRLPWYLAIVTTMSKAGIEFVSSTRIAEESNVDASQIAKDLSFLNIKGKTRIGYEVSSLEKELREFLGFMKSHRAIMVGSGSLGGALIHDSGLQRYGLEIVAGIDVDPAIVGSDIAGIHIYHPDDMERVITSNGVTIGIIAVPANSAQDMADRLVEAGIRALWNFTPRRLRVPKDVVITNTSIYSHLAVMYHRLSQQ